MSLVSTEDGTCTDSGSRVEETDTSVPTTWPRKTGKLLNYGVNNYLVSPPLRHCLRLHEVQKRRVGVSGKRKE